MSGRSRRLQQVVELIKSGAVVSQDDLAAQLSERGFECTQATLSRDLKTLGAVKVQRMNGPAYVLPDQLSSAQRPALALEPVLRDWARSIRAAGTMVVIKSPPGTAHILGVSLDNAARPEVVGTICGDDTTFVACPSEAAATRLVRNLEALATG